tara:strand:- start:340 stop:597 length:258 start_codon:yes stop_codon:yes gene_type:complete
MTDKYMIIHEKSYQYTTPMYSIYNAEVYSLTDAVKKILALDTLNEDRKRNSYHLQKVNFSAIEKPLPLTEEVTEDHQPEQDQLPF